MKARRHIEHGERASGNPSPGVPDRGEGRVGGRSAKRPVRDDVLHIRICSDLKEAFFTLAAQRGMFGSELLLELIEGALREAEGLCTQLSRPA